VPLHERRERLVGAVGIELKQFCIGRHEGSPCNPPRRKNRTKKAKRWCVAVGDAVVRSRPVT
jgi:hypothetical protein